MKYILTLVLLAGFVACGASSPQIGGEFTDFRKPAGLYLGMNADDCGKLRDKDGAIAENGWESVIINAGKRDRRVYGLEFINGKSTKGDWIRIRFDALKEGLSRHLGRPVKEETSPACWIENVKSCSTRPQHRRPRDASVPSAARRMN